ncbi:hypothetical protein M9980_01705 [Sphingomonas donggukensis]|uniref:DUF6894 domain-containing protein n=1 Tax=Sphingomonas donggukensis TaxID=2949093 RepID=A0ABY4TU97_9SPHN|nr:hypothetical protein [Sphingomonas donggukensis]URW75971.1 hypothetical protein M9980_01705 [Sphingomonas donggukensis]
MPRYRFNIHSPGNHLSDGEGLVLLDDATAVERARQIVREMVAIDLREDGVVCLAQTIEIVGDGGKPLASMPFGDIIQIIHDDMDAPPRRR